MLIVLFIGVPFAEIYVLLQVGQAVGVLNTLVLLVLISVVGAWLAKREGLGVFRRMQRSIEAGRVPGTELDRKSTRLDSSHSSPSRMPSSA